MLGIVRLLSSGDIDAADRLLMRAFASEDSFRPVIEREFAIQPGYYWVSESAGEILGSIAAVAYGRVAYIGMMAVDPASQSRGIGRMLLETAINALEHDGYETMLLDATDAGEPLYRKYGFVDQSSSYDLRGQSSTTPSREIAIPREDARSRVLSLDAATFGADRSNAIQHLLSEPSSQCLISESDGELDGYLIAQKTVLGPWVAHSPEIAEKLLLQALSVLPPQEWRVMQPVENSAGLALLQQHGFEIRREVLHMRRGRPFQNKTGRAVTYGQASFALG
jgi:ribosomal protein S18 acetylase RimI-like enzyme